MSRVATGERRVVKAAEVLLLDGLAVLGEGAAGRVAGCGPPGSGGRGDGPARQGERLPGERDGGEPLPPQDTAARKALEAVKREAAAVEAAAAEAANRLLAEAREQAERLEAEAHRRGYEDGFRAGEQAARREAEPAIQALWGAAERLARLEREAAARYQAVALKLALAAAERVVGSALGEAENWLREGVAAALERLPEEAGTVTVRLHPAALARFDALLSRERPGLRWVADDRLGPGDFVVETPQVLVDGQFQTRWDRVGDALYRTLTQLRWEEEALEAGSDPDHGEGAPPAA